MSEAVWQVIIADLASSRELSARERPGVDRALRRAIARTVRRFEPHFRLAPEVLRGDELQAVLRAGAPALAIVTYLRAQLVTGLGRRIRLRAGLGRGRISRMSPRGPFASDGEAFHRARRALDRARGGGGSRVTEWVAGDRFFDALAHAVLGLADAFVVRWTVPQWEAIAGRLEGRRLHGIARGRGVSFQSVSKRLRAAAWNDVQPALELLESASRVLDGGAPAGRVRRHAVGGAGRGARARRQRGVVRPQKGDSRRSRSRG